MPTQIDTSASATATAAPAGTSLGFAASDAAVAAIYYDGAYPKLATFAGGSWATQAIGSTTPRDAQALVTTGDDVSAVFASPSSGLFGTLFSRSGNTWTVGSLNQSTGQGTAYGGWNAAWMGRDAQGRVWAVGMEGNGSATTGTVKAVYTSDGTFGSVVTSLSVTTLPGNLNQLIAAAIVGGYLVVVYWNSTNLVYQRANVAGASVGSWSSATNLSVSDYSANSDLAMGPTGDASKAALVYKGTSGIEALIYDPVADTWGSATTLSSAANDQHATVSAGASGSLYVVWAQYSATNSYALVAAKYSGGSWGSVTTLEAAGNNIAYPHAAWDSVNAHLALLWTQGTASPYSVEFDTYTPAAGSVAITGVSADWGALAGALAQSVRISGIAADWGALAGTLTAGVRQDNEGYTIVNVLGALSVILPAATHLASQSNTVLINDDSALLLDDAAWPALLISEGKPAYKPVGVRTWQKTLTVYAVYMDKASDNDATLAAIWQGVANDLELMLANVTDNPALRCILPGASVTTRNCLNVIGVEATPRTQLVIDKDSYGIAVVKRMLTITVKLPPYVTAS